MLTSNRIKTVMTLAAVTMATLVLTTTSTFAQEVIYINNADFEDFDANGGGTRGNWHVVSDWDEETPNTNEVYIEDNGLTWKPEADRVLYLNAANTAVNQDLSHNWSSSDSYTLGIIGERAGWYGTTTPTAFKVELRQTDGTVLWDSESQDITDTVSTSSPYTYTGTGHIFSWTIDASTFGGEGVAEGEALNIRIAHTSGTPYLDDVSLSLISSLQGDADENGVVDAADYIALKRNMGLGSGAELAQGDFDENGTVDWDDLQILIGAFDAGDAAQGVPEPATLGMLAFGALAVIRRRRA